MPSIEEILDKIPQKTQDYMFHKKFMYQAILATQAKKALEVGTDVGDSARIFGTALRETAGELISIDLRDVDQSWCKEYPNVKLVKGDSRGLQLTEPIDLLYIDGDHHYTTVILELKNIGKWVRKGGIILVHDTCHSEFSGEITKAVREFCRINGFLWTEDPQQHGMGVIEVIHEIPR